MLPPIKPSYWVVPGAFLAGEYPRDLDDESSREKIDALLQAGITVFIDLTQAQDGLLPYAHLIGDATHRSFPIQDMSTPHSPEFTAQILDTIDQSLAQGERVYVHCWGGIGRTGTIVGCWLARHNGGGEAGMALLQERWQSCSKSATRRSPETRAQEAYVLAWTAGE